MTTTTRTRSMTLLLGVALGVAGMLPALAAPVCSELPEAVCGNRIFAEPANSATFIQHDSGEYEKGIKALAARFPRFVRVSPLSALLGDPSAVSEGGREIWVIEVTDFEAPEEGKLPVVVSLSVHGPERAGLEGGVRYAEDLARWATSDPGHLLRNGTEPDSSAYPVAEVLQQTHLYLSDINPDGWSDGDLANGGVFARGNGNGIDLNREFPTIGWTRRQYTPLSESESISWDRFVRQVEPVAAADLHGELTSVNSAFADLMLPAGQWDPLEQAQEHRLARHMTSNVSRYFEEEGVVIQDVAGPAAEMRPADYATGYDVVGYDASGFMGDYFTQQGALEIDVEHFVSHMVPNSAWFFPLEQAHVAAVRAEIEALVVEALVTDEVDVSLDLGRTGYLFDPRIVTDADEDGYGGPPPPNSVAPLSYAATPMRYFEDLGAFANTPLRRVPSAEMASSADDAGLAGLDSFVLTTWPLPPDTEGREPNEAATVEAIRAFVEAGGNLVLTDEAVALVEDLGLVENGSVARSELGAGHVDIATFDDPYAEGLHSTASQTYYEVPLGYSIDEDASPHWTVERTAWEAAGGTTVGTAAPEPSSPIEDADTSRVVLGRISAGEGTVGIIGALLPMPTEEFDHFFGLADYGVTVTGGTILNNMLAPAS